MSTSTSTPIIVGVGQVSQRHDDVQTAHSPLDLMQQAAVQAARDTGLESLLKEVDSVRVVRGMWGYKNPALRLARALSLNNVETALTSLGGNYVQVLTSHSFKDIQSGKRKMILLSGAECGRTQARASKQGVRLDWNPVAMPTGSNPERHDDSDPEPDLFVGSNKVTRHEAELKRGIERPIQFYPMFEIALRHRNGESVNDHLARVSELWANFNDVATRNPNAWIQNRIDAETIRTPSPSNRPVSFPYTKLMNSNNSVDQGAALIVTSAEFARSLGIDESCWIYPHAATEAWDHLYVSERNELNESPAIRLCGQRLGDMLGHTVAQADHVDLYSCFPSAVQVAARELGLSTDRPLTVTGGLTFGGGPLNNYVMHGIARMSEVLRAHPGEHGLVTANGGLLTKHAMCWYSTEAPKQPFQWQDLQQEADLCPRREVVVEHDGEVAVETYVVMYKGEQPNIAHVACRLPDGRRTWGNVSDPQTVKAMLGEEFCGRQGRLSSAGELTL